MSKIWSPMVKGVSINTGKRVEGYYSPNEEDHKTAFITPIGSVRKIEVAATSLRGFSGRYDAYGEPLFNEDLCYDRLREGVVRLKYDGIAMWWSLEAKDESWSLPVSASYFEYLVKRV